MLNKINPISADGVEVLIIDQELFHNESIISMKLRLKCSKKHDNCVNVQDETCSLVSDSI